MPTHRNEKEGYRRALRALRLQAEAKAMPTSPRDKMMRVQDELSKALAKTVQAVDKLVEKYKGIK